MRYDAANQPPNLYEPYRSTVRRARRKPLIFLPHTLSERPGPVFGHDAVSESDHDLTRQHTGEPQGERIIVTGRAVDDSGRGVVHSRVEIWQPIATGRYRH